MSTRGIRDASPTSRRWLWFLSPLLAITGAAAHQDPAGDIHPRVVVEDGNFAVYFYNNTQGDGYTSTSHGYFRTLHTAKGQLLAPRHSVEGKPSVRSPLTLPRFHDERPSARLHNADGTSELHALAWPQADRVRMIESSCLSPGHIAAALKLSQGARNDASAEFYVYLFNRERFAPPQRFMVGTPSMIYTFPTASNLVFANGKFWLAWVRNSQEMVLSSVTPGSEKAAQRVLDTPADWNSHLSMAAIGDRLCLAYHLPSGGYPGRSKIVTLFFAAE